VVYRSTGDGSREVVYSILKVFDLSAGGMLETYVE